MPHDTRLFADGNMRLVVLIGSSPVARWVVAARERLFGEIVRLAASFVDEIGGEIQTASVAGQPVKLDQRELDLLMPGITAFLSRTAAKCCGDVIDVTLHNVEHLAP